MGSERENRRGERETLRCLTDLGNHGLMPTVYPVKVTN